MPHNAPIARGAVVGHFLVFCGFGWVGGVPFVEKDAIIGVCLRFTVKETVP